MPNLTCVLWHDRLSLFIKQALRLRLVRVARAAASARGGPQRHSHRCVPRSPRPENYPFNNVCGSLNRAVRRRPLAADCNSPMARACPAAVGEQHTQNRKCSPQPPAAEARCRSQMLTQRSPQTAARTPSPRSGVIFGGSRKARPPQPPKINVTHIAVNVSADPAREQKAFLRPRRTAGNPTEIYTYSYRTI